VTDGNECVDLDTAAEIERRITHNVPGSRVSTAAAFQRKHAEIVGSENDSDYDNVFISDLSLMRPNRQLGLYADMRERKIQAYATPLRELTCHMGSHSVTCHPTEMTFPPLPQPKLVLD